MPRAAWRKPPHLEEGLGEYAAELAAIVEEVRAAPSLDAASWNRILRRHGPAQASFSKSDVIRAFRHLARDRGFEGEEPAFLRKVRRKPVRTRSGVTPVTVLTRPFPCPGTCIFCPSDTRMPKSYLSLEPGAQRAAQNSFDPYRQTWVRLRAFHDNGHSLDKVELIVLGGTWSSYPEEYQIWFVRRCLDALNDFEAGAPLPDPPADAREFRDLPETVDGRAPARSYNDVVSDHLRAHHAGRLGAASETSSWEELERAQQRNADGPRRCVGLVLETRPDCVSTAEVLRLRRLGATRIQIGVQSLDDAVLSRNRRGHDVAATRRAIALLRRAGFKIQAHWMPNLPGSTPAEDVQDLALLFEDPDFRPDELKIYPCVLIASSELMREHEAGRWRPYRQEELLEVLVQCMGRLPRYCRLNRVIRDIPSHDVVAGNRVNNLREVAERDGARRGLRFRDVRSRQIRRPLSPEATLEQRTSAYSTSTGTELFLESVTGAGELVGFLRLSLPTAPALVEELDGAALVREVHVYGTVVALGKRDAGEAQHAGVGRRLLQRAEALAARHGYRRLAVISAVGTRRYYEGLGFVAGPLYHRKPLADGHPADPAGTPGAGGA